MSAILITRRSNWRTPNKIQNSKRIESKSSTIFQLKPYSKEPSVITGGLPGLLFLRHVFWFFDNNNQSTENRITSLQKITICWILDLKIITLIIFCWFVLIKRNVYSRRNGYLNWIRFHPYKSNEFEVYRGLWYFLSSFTLFISLTKRLNNRKSF